MAYLHMCLGGVSAGASAGACCGRILGVHRGPGCACGVQSVARSSHQQHRHTPAHTPDTHTSRRLPASLPRSRQGRVGLGLGGGGGGGGVLDEAAAQVRVRGASSFRVKLLVSV